MDGLATLQIRLHRQKKLIERKERLERRRDIVSRIDDLLTSIKEVVEPNSDLMEAYINETQVNLDFTDEYRDKVYFCCSKAHDSVRLDLIFRGVSPDSNSQLLSTLNQYLSEPYKENNGARTKDTCVRFMANSEDVPDIITKLFEKVRPNIKR